MGTRFRNREAFSCTNCQWRTRKHYKEYADCCVWTDVLIKSEKETCWFVKLLCTVLLFLHMFLWVYKTKAGFFWVPAKLISKFFSSENIRLKNLDSKDQSSRKVLLFVSYFLVILKVYFRYSAAYSKQVWL